MIHMKVIKLSDIKKILVLVMLVAAVALFIKSMPHISYVQAFSQDGVQEDNDSIYRIIMNKSLPMLDAAMGSQSDKESSQFIAYTLFKYAVKLDISNPKTYLKSQIPLLGLFNISEGLSGDLEAKSSQAEDIEEPSENSREEAQNTEPQPVVNANLDYSKPAVVIFHTHTSESYTPTAAYSYAEMGDRRTTDKNFDICRVGEEMKEYIEKYYGFPVIHDTTIHDFPSYNESYKRSKATIEGLVKKYPDALMYIDLHRDAEVPKEKITINIKNEDIARVMFVVGKANPHWQENYQLSQKLNQKIESLFPGLSRGISVGPKSLYNQHISNKMVLLEMGGDTNTLEEALASAKMVGGAIGQFIKDK